jgi:hypothetical protein
METEKMNTIIVKSKVRYSKLIGYVLVFFLPMIDDNNGNGVVLLTLRIYCQPHTA